MATNAAHAESHEIPESKKWQYFMGNLGSTANSQYPSAMVGVADRPFYVPGFSKADYFLKMFYTNCYLLEADYYRCASRVGLENVKRGNDCLMEFEDLKECISSRKQVKRVRAMKKEARRQGKPLLEDPVHFTNVQFNNEGFTGAKPFL